MPPNTNEFDLSDSIAAREAQINKPSSEWATSSGKPVLQALKSLVTLFVNVLTGIFIGVAILFAYRGGTELNATNQHILLCVIGYQVLMGQAILCLAPDSWSASLNLKHRRWMHWFLQILGSVLALAGSFIKMIDKTVHFNTFHGQFALVSVIFTTVCLVNGLASMYAHKLSGKIPPIISRLTHICFGIVAFGAASIALGYGFHKDFFRQWATTAVTDALIVMTGMFTTIVIINPFITFFTKSINHFKN